MSSNQPSDFNPLAWPGIDDNETGPTEQLRHAATEQYLLDLAFYNVFNTPDGKKVLNHLWQNTINAATWMPSLGYKKAIAHGFAREGQNALVRLIEQRMTRVQNARTLDDYLTKAGIPPAPKDRPEPKPDAPAAPKAKTQPRKKRKTK